MTRIRPDSATSRPGEKGPTAPFLSWRAAGFGDRTGTYLGSVRLLAVVLLLLLATVAAATAQGRGTFSPALLPEVVPQADRFSDKEGELPVYRAYGANPTTGGETLVGYAFLTSDLPPEVVGYLGPIQVLVGMDLDARITGIRVIWHREPLSTSRRDFLEDVRFLQQFTGKHVSEPFRLRTDLHGISGATVSVAALALGIRNAARRVASAYLVGQEGDAGNGARRSVQPADLSWFDLVGSGRVLRIAGEVDGMSRIDIFFADLWSEDAGEVLLGAELFERVMRRAGERATQKHVLFLGLDGRNLAWFKPELFFVVQGGDTLRVSSDDVFLFENLRGGKVVDQLRSAGIWLLDRRIDMSRPFQVGFGGELGLTINTVEHPGRPGLRTTAEAGRPADPLPVAEVAPLEGSPGPDAPPEVQPEGPAGQAVPEEALAAAFQSPVASDNEVIPPLDFYHVEEESQFARTLARTSWGRVGGLVLLLLVASLAFFSKRTSLRWLTLAGTVVFLGFIDRGFLSVSHISSAIVVGPGLFLSDLSLLILVLFTAVTTLLWGRVFCGYLCPFGVLQDLLDRFVPRRFKKRMPHWIHRRAVWVKYAILALVLVPAFTEVIAPALLDRNVSLYHYFEPFGTVFFLSPSLMLWAIAVTMLTASAIVPRFYCRYLCALGAALAVVSRVSPLRIRRVEQCKLCKVCEQSCPTGAIHGAEIDFPECVRCSVCEVKLIERAGTCRHDMALVRPRLIQIKIASK